MRYIFFSPHLDDAVLSAGGWIYDQTQAGHSVEIWTFMCGYPNEDDLTDFAKSLHKQWGTNSAEETVRVRREEDKKAASRLGATTRHFDFLDCVYRRGKNGEALYNEVFVPLHPAEADLPAQVAQTMVAWLNPDDTMICQLAIGGHVDHVTVRQAAEMLKRPLVYDMDIPYHLRNPQDLAIKAAGMKESIQPVSKSGLKAWQKAIETYASQVDFLFESRAKMRQQIEAYWAECKGIRFWQPG